MKKLLFLLLISPVFAFAQIKTENLQDSIAGSSFLLKNNEVIYSKVFDSELNKSALLEKLQSTLPNIGNFEYKVDAPNTDKINGVLTGSTVNYRKYGGTLMGTNIIMNYPLYGNVVVQIKDYKYRVVITNLNYKNIPEPIGQGKFDLLLDDAVTKKKRTEFRTNTQVIAVLNYIDKHFTDLFDIKAIKAIDDF